MNMMNVTVVLFSNLKCRIFFFKNTNGAVQNCFRDRKLFITFSFSIIEINFSNYFGKFVALNFLGYVIVHWCWYIVATLSSCILYANFDINYYSLAGFYAHYYHSGCYHTGTSNRARCCHTGTGNCLLSLWWYHSCCSHFYLGKARIKLWSDGHRY